MTAGRAHRGEWLQHGLCRWEWRGVYYAFQMAKSLIDNLSTHTAIAPTQIPINMTESMGEVVVPPLKMACIFPSISKFICKKYSKTPSPPNRYKIQFCSLTYDLFPDSLGHVVWEMQLDGPLQCFSSFNTQGGVVTVPWGPLAPQILLHLWIQSIFIKHLTWDVPVLKIQQEIRQAWNHPRPPCSQTSPGCRHLGKMW